MSRARWAQAALIAAGLAACAHVHGASSAETSTSYLGGQAAQPSSWISGASSADTAVAQGPAGQAAQQYSWIGEDDSEALPATRIAQDGPSYLGGRAGQPDGWLAATPKSPLATGTSSLARAPGPARQH